LVLGLYKNYGEEVPKFTSAAKKFDDQHEGKLTQLIRE